MNERAAKDSVTAADQACGNKRMIATTVRYPEEAMAVIRSVAAEHGCSAAELARIATCGNISRYLGSIICVDAEQGERIEKILRDILSEMEQIRRELHRIGINFNQRLKLENIERKIENTSAIRTKLNYMEEKKNLERNGNLLSKEELDTLMRRFEAAAKKAGDGLWHILK